jgi:hypothetical protein
MTQTEARQEIWKRLLVTVINDEQMVGDWAENHNDLDQRRLEKACAQVARTIERQHLK